MRQCFGFRTGHNTWRRIVKDGVNPTKEVHQQFSLSAGGILDRNLREIGHRLDELTSNKDIIELAECVDQCFATILRTRISGRIAAFRNSPESNQSAQLIDYAPPAAIAAGETDSAIHETARTAGRIGDTTVANDAKIQIAARKAGLPKTPVEEQLLAVRRQLRKALTGRDWGEVIIERSKLAALYESEARWIISQGFPNVASGVRLEHSAAGRPDCKLH